MRLGYRGTVLSIKATALGGLAITSWITLAISLATHNWMAATTAICAIVLAYNPALGEIVDQLRPYLPGWLETIATLIGKFSFPKPTPVVPSPVIPPSPVVPPQPPIIPPHA